MKAPSSVYRLQLSENFTLKEATKLLFKLVEMGIEGIYCSPYFEAHSPHGYDVTNPNRINPLLATSKEYEDFCKACKKYKLFHIADVVPNHMGILGNNRWWLDVLKKGKNSEYAPFFDIDWSQEKIFIPLLDEKGKGPIFPKSPHYQMVDWKYSAKKTSYRRFFNINELIGLNIEKLEVFEAYHQLLFQLLKEKKIDGLRIDHPDGLYDPKQYFDRLRKKHKGLIVVEKILGWEEELPKSWKVEGSVGYEFANRLTGVFVRPSERLTEVYEQFTKESLDFEEILYEKKRSYMTTEMGGDIETLTTKLVSFSSLPFEELLEGVIELLAAFPVYRTYIAPKGKVAKQDQQYIEEALEKARIKERALRALDLLEKIFTLEIQTKESREFILRFQQLSAPIMAKGFEDITLYNYNRLLALNEVGGEPSRGAVSVEEFHAFCQNKQKKHPLGLLASSTHDTKRSLDVRMQIAPLSELPDAFEERLKTWSQLNKTKKTKVDGELVPEPNMEYFLYQTLLGVWPDNPSFERLWTVFQKSLRENRTRTSWREPNKDYEGACKKFLKEILKKGNPFLSSFEAFQKEIEEYGRWNSLAAAALKLGCPGIVDIYEGCENWRYTLVDPDNRRPVNFSEKDTIKSALHHVALNFRKKHKELFLEGKYQPISVIGPHKDHVVAYLRQHKGKTLLVASCRFFVSVNELKETKLILPKKFREGVQVFTEEKFSGKELLADNLFIGAPFAWVFFSEKEK